MTVGKTHSGKTTFGKKLAQKIKNHILIDNDQITEFLKDEYSNLYNSDFLENSNQLSPGFILKKELIAVILKNAFKTNLIVISTGANSTKKLRKNLSDLARKSGRKVIIIYFNLDEKILLDRIDKGGRSKKCLYHSKDFRDLLLNKQALRFESASEKEADYFFEIKKVADTKEVFEKVLKLLK